MQHTLYNYAVLIGLALPLPPEATAGTGDGAHTAPPVTIIGQSEATSQTMPTIIVRSAYDFAQTLSLKRRSDARLDADDVLIQRIQSWAMTDTAGLAITGVDIAPDHNLVIGTSDGSIEIVQVTPSGTDLSVTTSIKAADGSFVSPPLSTLSARTLDGTPLCITDVEPQQAVPMHFSLLLDRSLSMEPVLDQVKAMSAHFLTLLPPDAWCGVAPFNDGFAYTHPNFERCGSTDFGIEALEAFGGTDIYPLLQSAYANYARAFFDGRPKTVIVITDGYTLDDAAQRQALMQIKGDVRTFIYFIGGQNTLPFAGIADQFVTHQGDLHDHLSRYFEVVGQAFTTQQQLRIRACGDDS